MDLDNVAALVWNKCLCAIHDERALVVSDPSGERLEIARALKDSCPCSCDLATMEPTGMNGREPSGLVAKKMDGYGILIAPLEYSITHTVAVRRFCLGGGRAATMPGITKEIFLRAVDTDYAAMSAANSKLRKLLEGRGEVRLTTEAGTDMTMRLSAGRKVCNDDGIIRRGKVKNLPDGEVAFAPEEGSAEGTAVFDLSCLNARLGKPFKVEVRRGKAISCGHAKLWEAIAGAENGTNFAELGIGTNPSAKVTGNILEDEKAIGTAHIAFGTNASMGGLVQSSVHLDCVLGKPTISVDGSGIIKQGRFLF